MLEHRSSLRANQAKHLQQKVASRSISYVQERMLLSVYPRINAEAIDRRCGFNLYRIFL